MDVRIADYQRKVADKMDATKNIASSSIVLDVDTAIAGVGDEVRKMRM